MRSLEICYIEITGKRLCANVFFTTALLWIAENAGKEGALEDGNPNLLAVGGDSAGGNLAAVVSIISLIIFLPLRPSL